MSTKSALRAQFGQRVQIRDIDRVPSGSPARFSLHLGSDPNTPEAARLLARRHVPLRTAHRVLTDLMAGRKAVVLVPVVEDRDRLEQELASVGIVAKRHEAADISPRAVRHRTGLSQDEFALRFGLDAATVRNWEQGRTKPDNAARTLLWTIAVRPDAVEQSLEANSDAELVGALSARHCGGV